MLILQSLRRRKKSSCSLFCWHAQIILPIAICRLCVHFLSLCLLEVFLWCQSLVVLFVNSVIWCRVSTFFFAKS
uniref:IDP2420 n=1 Tax=Arundo donax TaxID=35708 RepID=A0A0A8XR60_ARUDO